MYRSITGYGRNAIAVKTAYVGESKICRYEIPYGVTGYYVATVSEHGNEEVIGNYVKNQGNEYKKLYRNKGLEGQLNIFDYM